MSTWSPELCQSAVKQEKHFQAAPASGLRVKVNVRKKWREIGKHANYSYRNLDSPEMTNVMVLILTHHLESLIKQNCTLKVSTNWFKRIFLVIDSFFLLIFIMLGKLVLTESHHLENCVKGAPHIWYLFFETVFNKISSNWLSKEFFHHWLINN